jgi:hypothetical protein
MDKPNDMAKISPVRYSLDSKFQFRCHSGVKCFTKCCRGINIILTPYDIILLKRRLQLPSDQFLAIYTEPQVLEKTEWTVREWRADQGVDVRDEINAEWTDLLVRKRSFPSNIKLTDQSKQLFFMVSYNIDQFRRFVFESSFLERYDVDAETIEKIRQDEVALLKFGLTWLKDILFNYKNFEVDETAQTVSVKSRTR